LEKQEYAKYFELNTDRIDILLWCMGKPTIDSPRLLEGDYICALGENARDYKTLMAVMKRLPEIRLELVVRPYNLIGLELPPNVRVHLDIPRSQAMNILYHSRFMVLPLQGATVYNGHVTLVAAQHLGKAMIVTDSVGIADYIFAGQNAEVYPAFDADALTNCITRLWHDPHRCQMLGDCGQTFAANNLTENNAKSYLKQLLYTYIETPE
jgi:glycosyltransferase involved in cell wall biosynthesis